MKTSIVVAILALTFSASMNAQNSKNGRYYMDVHKLEPGSVKYADVAGAHEKDLQTEGKYGVSFVTYWVDEDGGTVYCLSKADDPSNIRNTHKEAHGLIPDEMYEVIAGEQSKYTGNGMLFLDVHDLGPGNVTAKAVADAHKKDLAVEGKYKVNFINYWVDEKQGKVFCLSEAPSKEAIINTHSEAHGLVPSEIVSVYQGQ